MLSTHLAGEPFVICVKTEDESDERDLPLVQSSGIIHERFPPLVKITDQQY